MAWPLLVLLALPTVAPVDPVATPGSDERVVVVDPTPARGRLVEAALRARGLRLLDDAERPGLHGPDTRPGIGDREIARARLLAARTAFRQLDLDAATAAANDAARELLRLESPEDHGELFVDVLLLQAVLLLGRDEVEEARVKVLLATRLEPDRVALDAALHPPSLVEAWAAARSDDAGAARAVVVVRPRVLGGASADVIVDGRRAVVRAGLLELAGGPHLVTIRAPGCRPQSRIVDVGRPGEGGGGQGVAIEDVLIPDDVIAARMELVATLRRGEPSALRPLREQAGADVLVAIDVDGAVWAQRREAPAVRVGVAIDSAPDVMADAVIVALAPPVVAPVPPEVAPDEAPTWWLVGGGIGAAVLVGGAAVTTWMLWPGEAPPPPPRPVTLTAPVL